MKQDHEIFPAPEGGEPYLLTPGPLTTAIEVKRAMLPTGSRDIAPMV